MTKSWNEDWILKSFAQQAATFSNILIWVDILSQVTGSSTAPKFIQWVGGLGSDSGDGGSLNLAPAYALPCGDGDLDRLVQVSLGMGENPGIFRASSPLGLIGLVLSSQCLGDGVPLELEPLLLQRGLLLPFLPSLFFIFPDQVIS